MSQNIISQEQFFVANGQVYLRLNPRLPRAKFVKPLKESF